MSPSLSVVPANLLAGARAFDAAQGSSELTLPMLAMLESVARERLPGSRTAESLSLVVARWHPLFVSLARRASDLARSLGAAGTAYVGVDDKLASIAGLPRARW